MKRSADLEQNLSAKETKPVRQCITATVSMVLFNTNKKYD